MYIIIIFGVLFLLFFVWSVSLGIDRISLQVDKISRQLISLGDKLDQTYSLLRTCVPVMQSLVEEATPPMKKRIVEKRRLNSDEKVYYMYFHRCFTFFFFFFLLFCFSFFLSREHLLTVSCPVFRLLYLRIPFAHLWFLYHSFSSLFSPLELHLIDSAIVEHISCTSLFTYDYLLLFYRLYFLFISYTWWEINTLLSFFSLLFLLYHRFDKFDSGRGWFCLSHENICDFVFHFEDLVLHMVSMEEKQNRGQPYFLFSKMNFLVVAEEKTRKTSWSLSLVDFVIHNFRYVDERGWERGKRGKIDNEIEHGEKDKNVCLSFFFYLYILSTHLPMLLSSFFSFPFLAFCPQEL